MRPKWMPLWLWFALAYRPVLVRSINLRTTPARPPFQDLEDLVVTVEDWRGRRREVIRTGAGGMIDHEVTCIGIRDASRSNPEGT